MAHKHEHLPKLNKRQHDHLSAADMKSLYNQPAVVPDKEHRDDKHLTRRKKIAVGAVAAIAAVGGAVGVGKAVGGGEEAPRNEPSASAPANPGETEGAAAGHERDWPQPGAEPISAERYTTPEEVVDAYLEQNNNWYVAGATMENRRRLIEDMNASRSDAAQVFADETDAEYIDALYVSDWQSDESLAHSIESKKEIHWNVLDWYLMTVDSGEEADIEPYRRWYDYTEVNVLNETDDEFVAAVRFESHDNSTHNRAETEYEGQVGGQLIRFRNVDSVWKVGDVTPNPYG